MLSGSLPTQHFFKYCSLFYHRHECCMSSPVGASIFLPLLCKTSAKHTLYSALNSCLHLQCTGYLQNRGITLTPAEYPCCNKGISHGWQKRERTATRHISDRVRLDCSHQ